MATYNNQNNKMSNEIFHVYEYESRAKIQQFFKINKIKNAHQFVKWGIWAAPLRLCLGYDGFIDGISNEVRNPFYF